MSAEVTLISHGQNRDANWFAERDRRVRHWMLGDRGAIEFLECIGEFIEVWDDLIDKDVAVTDARLNTAFMGLLLGVACNPFVGLHAASLRSALEMMYQQWRDSERLQTHPSREMRAMAFHLRNSSLELYQVCAMLVGGYAHLDAVSVDIREFFATERFADWEHYDG